MWWHVWQLLYYKFTAASQHFAEVSCLECPAERWRTRLKCDIWQNCCNSMTLWLILLPDLDSVISKTGLMSITCDSPTDAISNWTLIVCAAVFSRHLSSWLTEMHIVGHYGRPMQWSRPLYFCPVVSLYLLLSIFLFFPHLISAAAGWMSTILWHMVWP